MQSIGSATTAIINATYQQSKKEADLASLCDKRGLSKNLFQNNEIKLSDAIEKHTAWVFQHIYSVPYPLYPKKTIARESHGIQHTARTAIYARVFVNLYKRYQYPGADKLTEEDIKLLQITALFHDSGRLREGVDYWDKESALFLYEYLTNVLKISDPKKAKLLAEAIANKDSTNTFFELDEKTYQWNTVKAREKNIYERIIQNADCLDIIRERDNFSAEYLDFFKDIAKNNPRAFEEMAHLIVEARSIIVLQGDEYQEKNITTKENFEHENAYQYTLQLINDTKGKYTSKYKIISTLYHTSSETLNKENLLGHLSAESDEKYLLQEQRLEKYIWQGMVYARVINPTDIIRKENRPVETNGEFEFRKITRINGIKTRTRKNDSTEKQGFPGRSTSLIGPNCGLYQNGSVGYFIVNPDVDYIHEASTTNLNSGVGKKKDHSKSYLKDAGTKTKLILNTLKKGGAFDTRRKHTEITMRVLYANAVFYSFDPTDPSATQDKIMTLLKAVYMQKTYAAIVAKNTEFVTKYQQKYKQDFPSHLPIIEYSYKHNHIQIFKPFTDQQIQQMWLSLHQYFFKKTPHNKHNTNSFSSDEKEFNNIRFAFKQLNSPLLPPTTEDKVIDDLAFTIEWGDTNKIIQFIRNAKKYKLNIFNNKTLFESFADYFTSKKMASLDAVKLCNFYYLANKFKKYFLNSAFIIDLDFKIDTNLLPSKEESLFSLCINHTVETLSNKTENTSDHKKDYYKDAFFDKNFPTTRHSTILDTIIYGHSNLLDALTKSHTPQFAEKLLCKKDQAYVVEKILLLQERFSFIHSQIGSLVESQPPLEDHQKKAISKLISSLLEKKEFDAVCSISLTLPQEFIDYFDHKQWLQICSKSTNIQDAFLKTITATCKNNSDRLYHLHRCAKDSLFFLMIDKKEIPNLSFRSMHKQIMGSQS